MATITDKGEKLVRLSASKLKLYERCPTAYVHRYVDKHESIGIHALMGSAVHKALEQFYKTGSDVSKTFHTSFSQWVNPAVENFELAMGLFTQGMEMVYSFDPSLYTPKVVDGVMQIEKYFRLPYPNKDESVCTLEGYMDIVTDTQVVDFKTGKDIVSRVKVENDLQFIIYNWAFEQLYGYSPTEIVYHRLRDQKQIIGKKFDRARLDTIIHSFLLDPMNYDPVPCVLCPKWCSVRKVAEHVIS